MSFRASSLLEAVVVDEGVSRDEGLERRHSRLDLRAELHRTQSVGTLGASVLPISFILFL